MESQAEVPDPPAVESSARRSCDRWLLVLSIGAVAVSLLMIHRSLDAPATAAPLPPVMASVSPAASPSPSTPSTSPRGPTPPPVPTPRPAPGPSLPKSPPTRLQIPQIHVDAPFTGLTLNESGALNAPPPGDQNLVGWYQDGTAPGEIGTAVVAGHVDTTTGPAVFLQLSTLTSGSTVDITRTDGIVATFAVDSVQEFPKDDFPDREVYGDAPGDAQLRLITCGGSYDRKRRDYVDNVVVFAHLQSFRHA